MQKSSPERATYPIIDERYLCRECGAPIAVGVREQVLSSSLNGWDQWSNLPADKGDIMFQSRLAPAGFGRTNSPCCVDPEGGIDAGNHSRATTFAPSTTPYTLMSIDRPDWYRRDSTTTHLCSTGCLDPTDVAALALLGTSWTVTLCVLGMSAVVIARSRKKRRRREVLEGLLLSQSCAMLIALGMRTVWVGRPEYQMLLDRFATYPQILLMMCASIVTAVVLARGGAERRSSLAAD